MVFHSFPAFSGIMIVNQLPEKCNFEEEIRENTVHKEEKVL